MSMKLRKPRSTQLALKWTELLQRLPRQREDERTARCSSVHIAEESSVERLADETTVVRHVQTLAGHNSYLHQLDRARRFLARAEAIEGFADVDFQDVMWAFFQNCWHVKDWVLNDSKPERLVPGTVRQRPFPLAIRMPLFCELLLYVGPDLDPSTGLGNRRQVDVELREILRSADPCAVPHSPPLRTSSAYRSTAPPA